MVTRNRKSSATSHFWRDAFCKAELATLLRSNGRRLSAQGAAHLCAEFADAAVTEYRRRFNRGSK
jgi:hypothetical protein